MIVCTADNTRTFDIDVRPLTTHSDFFATMLGGPWHESQTRTVTLEDDDPDVFSIFALFIYTGKIFSARANDVEVYLDGSRRDKEWVRLARAWILGDKLQSTSFRDAVSDAMCDKIVRDKKWPITLHQIIYAETTPVARGIRRLCVDIAVAKWDARTLRGTLRDESWSEFFEDVSVRLMGMREERRNKIDFKRQACTYHEHVAAGTGCWKGMEFLGGGAKPDVLRAVDCIHEDLDLQL